MNPLFAKLDGTDYVVVSLLAGIACFGVYLIVRLLNPAFIGRGRRLERKLDALLKSQGIRWPMSLEVERLAKGAFDKVAVAKKEGGVNFKPLRDETVEDLLKALALHRQENPGLTQSEAMSEVRKHVKVEGVSTVEEASVIGETYVPSVSGKAGWKSMCVRIGVRLLNGLLYGITLLGVYHIVQNFIDGTSAWEWKWVLEYVIVLTILSVYVIIDGKVKTYR